MMTVVAMYAAQARFTARPKGTQPARETGGGRWGLKHTVYSVNFIIFPARSMDNKENGGPVCLESAGERLVLFDSTGRGRGTGGGRGETGTLNRKREEGTACV